MIRLLFLIVIGWVPFFLKAQGTNEENASLLFHGAVSLPMANVNLPPEVVAPQGQVTLFADFSRPADEGTSLYLVNRSDERLVFDSQDGDIYIKLEFQRPDGKWQRAQAHQSSGCGNSYGSRILAPGQHFTLRGYLPKKGTPAKVRYACFGSVRVVSNIGEALFSMDDVEATHTDSMVMKNVPPKMTNHLCVTFGDPNYSDISLGVACLELAQVMGGPPILKKNAWPWLNELSLRQQPTQKEVALKDALQAVIDRPWSEVFDRERLLNHCLEKLKSPEIGRVVETPSWFLWQILGDLAREYPVRYGDPAPIRKAAWKPVLQMASETVSDAPADDQAAIVELLVNETIVDEWLSDTVFEPFLESSNKRLVTVAANTLSRHARWDRLVELGWKLNPEAQIIILTALARGQNLEGVHGFDGYGGVRTPEPGSPEELFWQHCMKALPMQAASSLRGLLGYEDRPVPYETYLRYQLLSYWIAQADRSEQAGEHFPMDVERRDAEASLEVLAPAASSGVWRNDDLDKKWSVRRADVVAILRRLLVYRGYQSENDSLAAFQNDSRSFFMRDAAREALIRMGEPVTK